MELFLADEAATINLGCQLAQLCPSQQFVIYLEGDLGAGKTTLSRGLLRALGHKGHVKSPTYTLVECYELASRTVCHFDLYRLADPEELDYLGLDDYFSHQSLCIIEWAINGGQYLPKPDLIIQLKYQHNARSATVVPHSPIGKDICSKFP